MGCFYNFCPCQAFRPSLTEEDIKCGSTKRELLALRQGYIQDKGFTVIEVWEYAWWRLYKTITNVNIPIRGNFSYRRLLTERQLIEKQRKKPFWPGSMRH